MQIDHDACDRFWREYLGQLPADHEHQRVAPDAFALGGGGALADELGQLVLVGRKRATTSLPVEFKAAAEPLPQRGSLSIVVDSHAFPVALIERTEVWTVPFDEVSKEYAVSGGEGDGSLAYWRQRHIKYFEGVCQRLGGSFDSRTPVFCQVFRVVWPHVLSPSG